MIGRNGRGKPGISRSGAALKQYLYWTSNRGDGSELELRGFQFFNFQIPLVRLRRLVGTQGSVGLRPSASASASLRM